MLHDLSQRRFILLNDYTDLGHGDGNSKIRLLRFLKNPDNIGNIVFLDAINRLLPGMHNVSTEDFIRDHNCYKGFTIVLALANFLSETWKSTLNLLDILEDHHFILLSVGIQSELNKDQDIVLSADAIKLLQLAQFKGSLVGVRGSKTERLLNRLGIECQVIGCPSVYLIKHWQGENISSNNPLICFNNTMDGKYRETAQHVNRLAMLYGTGYVYQTEVGLIAEHLSLPNSVIELIAEEALNPQHCALLRNRDFDCGYYNLDPDAWVKLKNWFLRYGHFFPDIQSWRNYARKFDYCIGTRIHGGIAALQSGSRAIFINVDARVQEMTDFHKLPSIQVQKLSKIESVNELICTFNMDEYNEKFDNNYKQFCEFITFHVRSRD